MNYLEDKSFSCDSSKILKADQEGKNELNVCIKGNIFSDQTPTPTRFIRNCEEVGLFQDLQNVNPFEETFRKAAEAVQKGNHVIGETVLLPDDTLHTPNVFPLIPEAPQPTVIPPPLEHLPVASPACRKYSKRRRRIDNTPDPTQYVVVGSNVTFKLPIPRLPPAVKVFSPKYFKPSVKPVTDSLKIKAIPSAGCDKQESNRLAAMRSRQKKKHYIAYLEGLNEELTKRTVLLEKQISSLVKKNRQLKLKGAPIEVRHFMQQTDERDSTVVQESKNCEADKSISLQQILHQTPEAVHSEHNYLSKTPDYADQRRMFYATLPSISSSPSANTCILRKPFKKRRVGRKESEVKHEPWTSEY